MNPSPAHSVDARVDGPPPARSALLLIAAFGLLLPTPVHGQATAPPSAPGTAVLYTGPLDADTLPILCVDGARARSGFVTERTSAEWTPTVDLRVAPVAGSADSLFIAYDDGSTVYERTVLYAGSATSRLTASINLVPWDDGRGVDLYFSADCSVRLDRGG
ncbi:MAG: hypothetical protein R3E98_20440 [Gemmatimonadota bacterium]